MFKFILFYIPFSFILFTCSGTDEQGFENSSMSFKKTTLHFDVSTREQKQVHNNAFYFLSDLNKLYKIKNDEIELVYSLKNDSLIWKIIDFQMHNDTTFSFIDEDQFESLSYFIENFFITDETLFLTVRVYIPYIGKYNERDALISHPFSTLLKINLEKDSVEFFRSLSLTKSDFESVGTNYPSSEFGFTILPDGMIVIKNLAFTNQKESIPELMAGYITDRFRFEASPLIYYRSIPKSKLTTEFAMFYGNDRQRYVSDDTCLYFSHTGKIENRKTHRISEGVTLAGYSDSFSDSLFFRCLKNENQEIELQLLGSDSIYVKASVGILNENIITFDFIDKEAWFLRTDSVSNGFFLERYFVSP